MHSDLGDFVMYWISDKFIFGIHKIRGFMAFYLFLLYLVILTYKLRTIDVLICVVILITISDAISVHCFKEVFHRLRPCQDPSMRSLIHIVNGRCGGLYSFVSSHAANTFALVLFLIKLLGKKIKYLTPVMIIWAAVVSYSRIYLGVHYPLDVLCGVILGVIVGITIGNIFNWYYKRFVLKLKSSD